MKKNCIRIFEDKKKYLSISLSDILKEIYEGESFFWNILFLDGAIAYNQGENFAKFIKQINESSSGIFVSWHELFMLTEKFDQIFETIILGSKDINLLHRYKNENEMYKSCEVVIELIDCYFWQIVAKDQIIIKKLAKRFSNVKLMNI